MDSPKSRLNISAPADNRSVDNFSMASLEAYPKERIEFLVVGRSKDGLGLLFDNMEPATRSASIRLPNSDTTPNRQPSSVPAPPGAPTDHCPRLERCKYGASSSDTCRPRCESGSLFASSFFADGSFLRTCGICVIVNNFRRQRMLLPRSPWCLLLLLLLSCTAVNVLVDG